MSLINAIRSIIFNVLFIGGSLLISIILLPVLLLPSRFVVAAVSFVYGGFIAFIERWVIGIKLEIRGMENIPKDRKYIIAAKHQSAFETLKLPYMKALGYPVIILKKELVYIPLWGLYPLRMELVAINRSHGVNALREMTKGCRRALSNGRPIAIFPQGTRVAPGAVEPYKSGLAKIYKDLEVPVVPMALNAGVFWGRNAFFKKPGKVVFEFLPPIPAGLPPLQVMKQIEEQVEAASNRLLVEASLKE